MKDRDCESCKKFSLVDPNESEGYCDAKRTWVDPEEGEDCKMHEFTLHSANKYKDGTPIYAEPSGLTIGALSDVLVKHTAKQKELSNQLDSLEQRVDELSEEYDAVLKTHGDTLEEHMERITINEGNIDAISYDVEDLQRKVAAIYQFLNSAAPGTFFKIMEELKRVEEENIHNGSNFCGNCTHCEKHSDDTVYICTLSHGIVDPDDSSCSHFEPPF